MNLIKPGIFDEPPRPLGARRTLLTRVCSSLQKSIEDPESGFEERCPDVYIPPLPSIPLYQLRLHGPSTVIPFQDRRKNEKIIDHSSKNFFILTGIG